MDSLEDILKRYGTPENPELVAIKRYIDEQYHTPVSAAIRGDAIVITVPSAALANTLRLQISKIQALCQTQKRIIFRIG